MKRRISIITPDHAELDFEPAGIGSRLLAFALDVLLIGLSILVLLLMIGFLAGALGAALGSEVSPEAGTSAASWALALIAVMFLVVIWGYFVLFEALGRGQTPGKRQTGIRVVRNDGLPVGWREAALRNLVRFADLVPPPSAIVGIVSILVTERGQRLGDLLAGTMVVREEFGFESAGAAGWEEAWVVRVESGRSRRGIVLADTRISAQQMQVIERFLSRRNDLAPAQRQQLAWRIARPLLGAMGEDAEELEGRGDRFEVSERVLEDVLDRAGDSPESRETPLQDAGEAKRTQWMELDRRITSLHRTGVRGLRALGPEELKDLLRSYRSLVCDLARARSMGRGAPLARRLNSVAVRAHNILYGHLSVPGQASGGWVSRFPIAVRSHWRAVALSAVLLFAPAVVSYVAVQLHPELGYDLVPEGFLDFEPAREDSIHDIPGIVRPLAASGIMTNNIQVTLLAFGLGLTFGIGTGLILVFNGVQLGAVAGWMSAAGNSRALWGWIFPHGGTELMAVTLAGAAGFVLARALIAPGQVRRSKALGRVAVSALVIELGVMAMLVVAGLIEGFVSPSGIGYAARLTVFVVSVVFWVGYLSLTGLGWERADGEDRLGS